MALVAAVVTGSAAITGCGGPDPQEVAGQLATGLSSGSLADVPITGATPEQATAQRGEIVAGLGDLTDEVRVASVSEDDEDATATASLEHSWTVPAGADRTATWTYRTTARMSQGDDGWQVRWEPGIVADVAAGETLSLKHSQAKRADVLGAGASTLVTDREVVRFGIDRAKITPEQAEASARSLAALVGVDPDSYATRVINAGPRQFVEAIVLRAAEVPQPVRAGIPQIPGAVALHDTRPLAPTREFARPVLGSVGEVTEEILTENPGRYTKGDVVGLSGLQARYDDHLGGQPGVAVLAGRQDGTPRTLYQVDPVPGAPLSTTLDPAIQSTAEDLLSQVGPPSAIVVIRPSTGEVLAAASGPGGQGYSTAMLGRYAPGSTFKVVTALALLRTGLTPDSPVECPAAITVDGRTFSNYSDFPADRVGTMTLGEALMLSCNTAFIGAAQDVSPDALASAAASLGIGWDPKSTGADAYPGAVPVDGTATEHAAARIGQGKVTTSPVAMATVMASIVNGSTVTPRLVNDPAPPAPILVGPALTPQEAEALRSMTAAVVSSGTARVLAGVPGQPVLAKTGTAEFGEAVPPGTRAWMIAGRGDLAVSVFVAEGASGSQTAGPIMADLLTSIPA
ncbi:MAG: penicillin-binding transpeptidase domain-containing protein [Actinomycetales bacterium]